MTQSILGPAMPQLPSGDIAVTEAFFTSMLGFQMVAKYPDFVILRRGEAEIHFWQTSTLEEAKQYGAISSCYIRVEQIDFIFQEFKARGVKFRYGLEKKPWGMNEMQIDDPYGNAIRFGERF